MVFFLKENLRIGLLVFSLKPEKIQVRGWGRSRGRGTGGDGQLTCFGCALAGDQALVPTRVLVPPIPAVGCRIYSGLGLPKPM